MTQAVDAEFWEQHRRASSRIETAAIVAYLSAVLTLALALAAASPAGATHAPFNWYLGIDAGVTLILGLAVRRGSPIAAGLLVLRSVLAVLALFADRSPIYAVLSSLFTWAYLLGLRGALSYSRLEDQLRRSRRVDA